MEYPELTDRYILVREALKLKAVNIVEQSGLSKSYISTVESYKTTISLSLISFLYRTFNVNMNWLFGGNGVMFNKDSSESAVERTYEEGYNDCLKDNEVEVIKLKAQIDLLLRMMGMNTLEETKQSQQEQEVNKATETPTETPRTLKYTQGMKDEVVPSSIRKSPRTPEFKQPMKAAATPLTERKPPDERPKKHD